jgi:hypothetical protein
MVIVLSQFSYSILRDLVGLACQEQRGEKSPRCRQVLRKYLGPQNPTNQP